MPAKVRNAVDGKDSRETFAAPFTFVSGANVASAGVLFLQLSQVVFSFVASPVAASAVLENKPFAVRKA